MVLVRAFQHNLEFGSEQFGDENSFQLATAIYYVLYLYNSGTVL